VVQGSGEAVCSGEFTVHLTSSLREGREVSLDTMLQHALEEYTVPLERTRFPSTSVHEHTKRSLDVIMISCENEAGTLPNLPPSSSWNSAPSPSPQRTLSSTGRRSGASVGLEKVGK
jgi:hypothetical protein